MILTDDDIWKNDDIMAANSGYGANFETLRELIRAVESALLAKLRGGVELPDWPDANADMTMVRKDITWALMQQYGDARALAAREQQWLPIESAPKDGTEVLLYFPHKDLVIRGVWEWQGEGDWESSQQDWKDWCTDCDVVIQEDPSYAPTLWMHVPPTPKKESSDETTHTSPQG